MGRHAKRGAGLRVSASTVVLGTLIVTVVAAGSLLSSYADPAPNGADGFGGAAAAEDAMTDGRLLPFGLVLAALLVAGAAVAVLIDVRRGRRARAHAAPRGRRRAVATASEAAQQVSAQQVSAQQVSAQQVSAQQVSAQPVSMQVPPPQVPEPGVADPAEYAEQQLLVDRELSSVDLSFPFTASLADSLHDELFTHRAVRS